MNGPIKVKLNEFELMFWDGFEFSQGSPLVYWLSVDGDPVGGEPFDPVPLPYGDSFLVARRAKGFCLYGFAIYLFDRHSGQFRRVSKVRPFLSLRSVGDDFVEAATKAYGDGEVERIPMTTAAYSNSTMT